MVLESYIKFINFIPVSERGEMSGLRVLVGCKRVIDYAVKVKCNYCSVSFLMHYYRLGYGPTRLAWLQKG